MMNAPKFSDIISGIVSPGSRDLRQLGLAPSGLSSWTLESGESISPAAPLEPPNPIHVSFLVGMEFPNQCEIHAAIHVNTDIGAGWMEHAYFLKQRYRPHF